MKATTYIIQQKEYHWTSQKSLHKYHRQREVLVKVTAAGVNLWIIWFPEEKSKDRRPTYKLPQTAEMKWSTAHHWRVQPDKSKNLKDRRPRFWTFYLIIIKRFEYVAVDSQALAGSRLSVRRGSRCCAFDCLNHYAALELMGTQAGKTIFISVGTGGVGRSMAIPLLRLKVWWSLQWGWR